MSVVMVAGSWDEQRPEMLEAARAVGVAVATHRSIVLTGGGTGVAAAAAEGARSAGGVTVAIIGQRKADDLDAALNKNYDVRVYTDTGWDGRSIIAVKSADVLVAVGGSNGTLLEISSAYLNEVPTIVLAGSSATMNGVRQLAQDGAIDHRRTGEIVFEHSVEDLLLRLEGMLG